MKMTLERKMNKQTAGMLGLKINVKLNGTNAILGSGHLKFIEEKPVNIHMVNIRYKT
jgi:hypothetical protein